MQTIPSSMGRAYVARPSAITMISLVFESGVSRNICKSTKESKYNVTSLQHI